jgi:hypothetical protein
MKKYKTLLLNNPDELEMRMNAMAREGFDEVAIQLWHSTILIIGTRTMSPQETVGRLMQEKKSNAC